MKSFLVISLSALILLGCSKRKPGSSNEGANGSDAGGLQLYQQGDEFGYRDIVGRVVIRPQFAEAGEFSEGLARVKPDAGGPWGFINSSGDMAIPPKFDGASDFHDGKAVVQSGDKFITIGPDGTSLGLFDEAPPYRALSAGDTLFVIHPNGLIVRLAGSTHASSVGTVAFGSPVEYVYDPHARNEETIDGLRGAWLAVRFGEQRGYMFEVYLSRYPQAGEKNVVESYKVVATGANNQNYSTYTLTKYRSGGRLEVHEGLDWAESQEITPSATVDQVVGRLKLFPSGEVGLVVNLFNGESGTFDDGSGNSVVITVRRDSDGFLDQVTFERKTDEENFDLSISRYSFHDVEITMTSTATKTQEPSE